MGTLFHRVERSALQKGDHIYSWRASYTYAHHGIYVAEDRVIHFMRGPNEGVVPCSYPIGSSSPAGPERRCSVCGYNGNGRGVVRSCLDCFLAGSNSLCRFKYAENALVFRIKRLGTCLPDEEDSPGDVLRRATDLLSRGDTPPYNLFGNNCEDFAIYCKTGKPGMYGRTRPANVGLDQGAGSQQIVGLYTGLATIALVVAMKLEQ